jgi:tetratricopeptide (TPR) repeat protein
MVVYSQQMLGIIASIHVKSCNCYDNMTNTIDTSQIQALYQAGLTLNQKGDAPAAIDKLRQAIALCHQQQELTLLMPSVRLLANILVNQGKPDEAIQLLQEQEVFYRQADYAGAVCRLMDDRGVIIRNQGDRMGALEIFMDALKISQQLEQSSRDANDMKGLSQVLRLQAEIIWDMSPQEAEMVGYDRAAAYGQAVMARLEAARACGDPREIAEAMSMVLISPHPTGITADERKEMFEEVQALIKQHGLHDLMPRLLPLQMLYGGSPLTTKAPLPKAQKSVDQPQKPNKLLQFFKRFQKK